MVYKYGGDRNGWSSTKVLRLPYTYNHKTQYQRPRVRMISEDFDHLNEWPIVRQLAVHKPNLVDLQTFDADFRDVIQKYAAKISRSDRILLEASDALPGDRSALIYKIVAVLYGAGASIGEIAVVLARSPYFASKYSSVNNRDEKLSLEIIRIVNKLRKKS